MKRREFIISALVTGASISSIAALLRAAPMSEIKQWHLSEEEWKHRLNDKQFHILREAGTEHSFSSPLNEEKRTGVFHCAGCDLDLFTSAMKFDSGTGWPSFFDALENRIETKTDFKLIYPRKEYHCARCGGHHGHIFKDGPDPTGLRYCNNGLALLFKPDTVA